MGAEIFFAFIIKNGLLKTVVPIKFQLSTVKLKFHGAFHVSLLFYNEKRSFSLCLHSIFFYIIRINLVIDKGFLAWRYLRRQGKILKAMYFTEH